jgi:SAM-dependent methyltransferase
MWDKGWERIFSENEYGKYPSEELIRFVAINYYKVPNRNDIKILEIGSGTGPNLWYLAREGFMVVGVEGSLSGVEKTKERLKKESLTAEVFVGDVMNLTFEDNSFDCVIDMECLCANTFKDSLIILDEVLRVLKLNGKFISRTFMTGSEGYGKGLKLEGEENTYTDSFQGTETKGCGIIRFTSEEEILELYNKFNIEKIDYRILTKDNQQINVKEWLIVCSKK